MRRIRIDQNEAGELVALDTGTGQPIIGVWRIEITADTQRRQPRVTLCFEPGAVDLAFDTTAELLVLPMPKPASMYGRT